LLNVGPQENSILTPVSVAGPQQSGGLQRPLMYLAELRSHIEPVREGVLGVGRTGRASFLGLEKSARSRCSDRSHRNTSLKSFIRGYEVYL